MKKLSVIIPVFNEAPTVATVLEKILPLAVPGWTLEVIAVDDGSTDGSAEKIGAFKDRLIFLRHAKNKGKGAAVRTALAAVTGEAVIIQDADLEYEPSEWPRLLAEFDPPFAPVVYGSRNLNPARRGYVVFVWGVRVLTGLTNLLCGSRLTDIYTCYKLFDAGLLKGLNLTSRGFELEAEVTVKILKRGIRIREVPINYYPRPFSAGKKINWRDGVKGALAILRHRFK